MSDDDNDSVSHNNNDVYMDEETPPPSSSEALLKPRQWIYDRSNGTSKDDDGETKNRPPCRLCWPPPCVKLFPDCFEQNCCCETAGRFGCVDGDKPGRPNKRTLLMGIGFGSNLLGLVLTIVACFGISTDYGVLEAFPYTRITATSDSPLFDNVTMSIGLVATAVRNPPNRTAYDIETFRNEIVIGADRYCEAGGARFRSIIEYEDCQKCMEVSAGLVSTVIVSCVTYVFGLSTNVLRMYPHYDVNCQKVFGVGSTAFSLVMSALTWNGYVRDCLRAFTVGTIAFDRLGDPVPVDSRDAVIHIVLDPHRGLGWIVIVTATLLKLIDIACHLALPTPSITRSRRLQLEYETKRKQRK